MPARLLALALFFALVCTSVPAAAAGVGSPPQTEGPALAKRTRKKKKHKKKKRKKRRAPLEVPIDIGVGPMAVVPNAPAFNDQPAHFALTLTAGAILDKAFLRRHRGQVPRQYRKYLKGVGRVTVRPLWALLIPEVIMVSPGTPLGFSNSDLYGAIWHPVGIGISPIDGPVRVYADLQLAVLGGWLGTRLSDGRLTGTALIRPGLSADVGMEIPLGENNAISLGWMSDVFIPQALGQPPLEVLPLEESLWHLGGPYLKVHFRFPIRI